MQKEEAKEELSFLSEDKPFDITKIIENFPEQAEVVAGSEEEKFQSLMIPYSSDLEAYFNDFVASRMQNAGFTDADIYLLEHKGESLAVKVFNHLSSKEFITDACIRFALRNCPQIDQLNQFSSVVKNEFGRSVIRYYLLTESAARESLYTLLKSPQKLTESQIVRIALDIAKGLKEMHRRGIIHKNICTYNIYITQDLEAKLSNFEGSVIQQKGVFTALYTPNNTFGGWGAPEMYKKNPITPAVDIYGLGKLLLILITRDTSLAVSTLDLSILKKVLNPEEKYIPKNCHPQYRQIMQACLAKNPKDRPTIFEVEKQLESLLAKISIDPHIVTGSSSSIFSSTTTEVQSTIKNNPISCLIL